MINELISFDGDFKLIVTIVKKGLASKIVAATKKAGSGGGTIILGRGTADRNIYLNILGLDYEPEKDIILTLVEQEHVDSVLNVILKEGRLEKPGKGIGFVIDVKGIGGIVHLLGLQAGKGK